MSTKVDKKNEAAQAIKINEKKWGRTLMDAGWTAFPSIILEKQSAFGLGALDINILLYLSTYWWEAENKPHPTKKTIAEAIGVDPRTVQRHIAEMESAGFIKREYRKNKDNGNAPNKYHFDGLIEEAEPYAQEKIEAIRAKREEEQRRRKRKHPQLKTIEGGKV